MPSGNVTLLFSDIEGSTALVQALGERYPSLLADHQRLLRQAFAFHHGVEVSTQGDGFFVAFRRAEDALAAAADGQRALADHRWPGGVTVRVRMGIHAGTPTLVDDDYVGVDVHRAARIMAAAHGGQVVVSHATRELVGDRLPEQLSLRDLGEHRLRDLTLPQRLYQLIGMGLERDFPALRTLESRPTNLPAQTTELVGRELELRDLGDLMHRTRLLTLTGPGGSGKTRLALQLAADLIERFPSGVFFVPLAAVRDAAFVLPAVAKVLGLKEQPGQTLEETVADYLRERELLLVLDNFEQIVEASPSIASLLSGAAGLRIVVTSRERLLLAGEQEYAVRPLPRADAVELFMSRARAVNPSITADEVLVAEICRRIDYLPLAIELAAARTKLLPLPALLERLNVRLALLVGGPRDRDERQRTLRAAIDWSYDLLSEPDRALLRRVAVFAGGWTIDAAEAVGVPDGDIDVLETLGSLVDKSLVREEERDGQPRFWLLETIREYALERLEAAGETPASRRRHADHFARIAERAVDELKGPDARRWLERLDDELDNVRAALAWARDGNEIELGLGIAYRLDRFWAARGHMSEGSGWLEQLLGLANETVPASLRGHATLTAAHLALWQGDYARAAELGTAAAASFRVTADAKSISYSLGTAGFALSAIEETERAATLFAESLALARVSGDPVAQASALNNLASLSDDEGDHAEALKLREECLALLRTRGDRMNVAIVLGNVGGSALSVGDYARAREALDESRALATELGDERQRIWALALLGVEAILSGNASRAEGLLTESIEAALAAGDRRVLPSCLVGFAACAAAAGNAARAARLAGAAEGARHAIGETLGAYDLRIIEDCRSRSTVDGETWTSLYAEGKSLPLEAAVAFALGRDA